MLQLNNLSVSYGETAVLFDVSIDVNAGEVVALLGSNGAGKTTTLKAAAGLTPVRKGKVLLDGTEITNRSSYDVTGHGLAHSPEGRRMFPRLTVQENLVLGTRTKESKTRTGETLGEVFTMFPILKERRKQLAGLMSGGEQQMCAIGRALMARPRMLLLDEPSLGLAPLIVGEVFEVIRDISQSGVTVLLVEQNVAQALQVADRGYVMERGHIVLSGSANDLMNDPQLQKAYLGV